MKKPPKIVTITTNNKKYKKEVKTLELLMNTFLEMHKEQIADEILKRVCNHSIRKV